MADHAGAHGGALLALHGLPVGVVLLLLLLDLGARHEQGFALRLLGGLKRLSPVMRLALLLAMVSATVHLSLVPSHLLQPAIAGLFAVDALAEMAVCVMACLGTHRWRQLGAALMAGNLLAYASFLLAGLETPDGVGLVTKLVEMTVLCLLSFSGSEAFVEGNKEVSSQ
jgi:hypothetical protein